MQQSTTMASKFGFKAGLALTTALALGSSALPCLAQTAAQAGSGAPSDDTLIVVTGSRIQNPNLVQASPVQVVDENAIRLQQPVSAEALIRDLPGAVPNIGAAVNNGANGSANVDLRGLGSNRNLVLIDGQRIVPAGLTAVTDVNNFPLALIKRVDITTGGGSSVYGADAVAGVVNFVTKTDFHGVEASANYGLTGHGDGESIGTDLTLGGNFSDDRGNAVLSLGYTHTEAVYQGDREFSLSSLSSKTGNKQGSGTTVPTNFLFPTSGQVDPATGTLVDSVKTFNFNPYNIFQTPFERYNLYSQARYELSSAIEVFAKGLFAHTRINSIIAPSGTFFNTYQLPLSNPFLPAGIRNAFCASPDIGISPAQCAAAATATSGSDPNYREVSIIPGRRFVEGGPRIADFTTDIFQLMAGARGPLLANLKWELRGQYGQSNRISTANGNGLSSRVQRALRATSATACADGSDGCVPLDLFGAAGSITPTMLAFLAPASTSFRTRSSLSGVNAAVNGDVGVTSPFATTPIGVAFGAEYRRYTAAIEPDLPTRTDNEVLGAGGAVKPVSGAFDVYEGFGELIAPLVENRPFFHTLTLEAGVRYSRYSTSGGSTAWKAGGSWQPMPSLKIRGIYQRAVRAANIAELFTPLSQGLANTQVDPCQGTLPLGNAQLTAACIASGAPAGQIGRIPEPSSGQINISFGDTPSLAPEKAETVTVGAVLTPAFLSGLSVSLDYFSIQLTDAIAAPNVDDILNACFVQFDLAVCRRIGRNPLNGSFNGGGETRGLPLFLSNSGRIATSGLDLSANYKHKFGAATVNVGLTGNYTFEQKFQATPISIDRECVGYYSVNCGLSGSIQPKLAWNQRTTVTVGAVDLSYLWRHIDGVEVEPIVAAGFLDRFRRIPAFDYFDLAARATMFDHVTLTLTVLNVFDRQPPIVGSTIGATAFNSGNTFPSTYDPLGRRFVIGAKLRF